MKHYISRLAILSLLLLGGSACSPNLPEGPDFSVFSIDYKIKTKWKWVLAEEGNENLTADWQNRTIEFTDAGFSICENDGTCPVVGSWSTPTKNTKLLLITGDTSEVTFTIERLFLNEMFLNVKYKKAKTTDSIRWELAPVKKRIVN
ncbi:MAG: hypothetical protein ACKVTZ_14155 [Bacteroidia bacterium]